MPDDPLTPEEIAKLRSLLPYTDLIRKDAEYSWAWRLVRDQWRSVVIGFAAVVGAVVVIWNAVKLGWQGLIGG